MDSVRKFDSNNVNKRHFPKLHERIQNKYNEMQRKIEKSKSIDMLTLSEENSIFQEPKRCFSTNDVRKGSVDYFQNEKVLKTESMSVENMPKMKAIYQDINLNEIVVKEIISNDAQEENVESENEDNLSQIFFADTGNFSKTSLESLQDIGKESDESLPTPSPTSKSLRNKIGSRIIAVREKRQANREKRKESREKVRKFIFTNTPEYDISRGFKRNKLATVSIALIEAKIIQKNNFDTEDKLRFLCCRLRIGSEKRKSKLIRISESLVKFQELINMNIFDETLLEVSLWDRDIFIAKHILDLSQLDKEQTHKIRINLETENFQALLPSVELFILLTISGTDLINTIVDLDDYQNFKNKMDIERKNFAWYKLRSFPEVGWLSVIVFGAKGLAASDCYCILKVNNERLFTHTEYKTQAPNWMKIFSFTVTDITSVLEVIIFDEKRSEEVGYVSIPLLKISASRKKWYALKGFNQRDRAKGNNPRILLEMQITWNLVKASVRVINPKEVNLLETEEKLDRQTFARNITRAKAIISWILSAFQIFKTMFEWESKKWNMVFLSLWLLFCWSFKTWMLPLLLLVPFAWYNPSRTSVLAIKKRFEQSPVEREDTVKPEKEEKNLTIRQKINSLQDMIQTVQRVIGKFASLGESVKNLFNFSVPFLSFLAIFLILVITLIMYLVPLNYILMAWGVHKFTRKILKPNRVPNNEVLDLLSRVPDDETLQTFEEFTLTKVSDEEDLL